MNLLGHYELLVQSKLNIGQLREIEDHKKVINVRIKHFLENFGIGAWDRVEEVSQKSPSGSVGLLFAFDNVLELNLAFPPCP